GCDVRRQRSGRGGRGERRIRARVEHEGLTSRALDDLAGAVGTLAAKAGTTDVVNAYVTEGALHRHDVIISSDPDDLQAIAAAVHRGLDVCTRSRPGALSRRLESIRRQIVTAFAAATGSKRRRNDLAYVEGASRYLLVTARMRPRSSRTL
ncbi:MAG TPA: hypothetical protein VHJ78_11745, partial [Actinomycetota bacterium]|nr:hypothetical protein [Actinomycetota bacterium]